MEWYDNYNVGVPKIDEQHRQLVHIISRLQDALKRGDTRAELANAFKFLVEYTQQHFHDEEEVMESAAFPDLENHREIHRKLIDEVVALLKRLKKGGTIKAEEMIDFLTDWLITHIVNEDKRIGRHLASITASREGAETEAEDTNTPPTSNSPEDE